MLSFLRSAGRVARASFFILTALCLSSLHAQAQGYTLTVEEHAVHTDGSLAGMTTYRVYVDMVNETDFLSAAFGNDETPLYLTTTTSFYNNSFATGSSADGIQPAFFGVVPELAYDSWVTIGIEGAPIPPEVSISSLESDASPWLGCFNHLSPNAGNSVAIDDVVGGGWYVLNGTPNGLPDPTTLRTLMGQFTTDGGFSGTMNAQIFPLGVGEDQEQLVFNFDGAGTYSPAGGDVIGCMVEGACNYNPEATVEGTCDYFSCLGCTDEAACNYDAEALYSDGSCEYLSCQTGGCTNQTACNYNPDATYNDNSCDFTSCVGCTDPDADNYDPDATTDSGQCNYLGCTTPSACNYDPQATETDGSCEFESCAGCTIASACNYDPAATIANNASCTYADPYRDCDGNCLNDTDGDGVCNEDEIAGCTDPSAPEYNPAATDDNGSCFAAPGCTVPAACNYSPSATSDDGSCEYTSCAGCTDEAACNYDETATLTLNTECTYPDAEYDCDGNCLVDTDGDGVCDPFEIGGCDDETACNYDANATDNDGSCVYAETGYNCAGECLADSDGDGTCDPFEVAGCTATNACNYDVAATEDDGSCDFCSCVGVTNSAMTTPYTLTVEEYAAHNSGTLAGMTTYRFYVNMVNATDFLSSAFGNDVTPLEINTTSGFYNDPFASGSTADGVNAMFFSVAPAMAYDSWVTIGIESAPAPPETAVSVVESSLQPWIGAFNASSTIAGQNILMDDVTGGGWFVLNGTPNGLPNPTTNRTLLMQLTTAGDISGTLNVQVFPLGVGANQYQLTYTYNGTGTFTDSTDDGGYPWDDNACGCTDDMAANYDANADYEDGSCDYSVPGCTDGTACNFDADATEDDGSCSYADAGYDCDGNCLVDSDGDGTCDPFEIDGCTDITACNYDATATDDDASCWYADSGYDCDGNCLADTDGDGTCDPFEVDGCTDNTACNYNAAATDDNGSCTYAETHYDCDGNCLADTDGDGICDPLEIGGCTDSTACNYNAAATDDNGSCTYAEAGYDCDGNCLNDVNENGICDEFESGIGCTDAAACNYDETATTDDGSCDFCSCMETLYEDYYTLTIEPHATGGVAGMTTYRVYVNMLASDDFLSSVFGNNEWPLGISTATGFYNSAFATGSAADGVNPSMFGFFPELAFDSWVTVGIESAPTPPQTSISMIESSDQPWIGAFNAASPLSGQNIIMDDITGGAWYVLNGTPNGLPDPTNNRTLIMQLTSASAPTGTLNIQVFPNGAGINQQQMAFEFNGTGTFLPTFVQVNACGCTDPEASNYDDSAVYENDSCEYIVYGCTDTEACNFNPEATDEDGSCTYPALYYDCAGNCLNDTDGDGVCDELEVPGCTDEAACNFDSEATDDNGSCLEFDACGVCGGSSVPGCMDPSACNFDPNAGCSDLSLCDWDSCAGCTDEDACNFDPTAEVADLDACTYSETVFLDCDGECAVGYDLNGNGICDPLEYPGCTDEAAVNYNSVATTDDGSCFYVLVGCLIPGAANYDPSATVQGIPVLDYCVFSTGLPAAGENVTDCAILGACNYGETGPCEFESCLGCTLATACNFDEGALYNDGSCEFTSCVGCLQDLACNYDAEATIAGSCDFTSCVGCTDSAADNFDPTATIDNGSCYVTGCMVASACNFNADATNPDNVSCTYADEGYDCNGDCIDANENGICDFEDDCVAGCMVPNACNYNSLATVDSGNCLFFDSCGVCGGDGIPDGACDCDGNAPEFGYSCEGECLVDADSDGVCDLEEVVGCQDDSACNFDPAATDAGYCDFAADGFDCDGNCLNDTDGDGVCDAFETAGCTAPTACNFAADATDDDGSCTFAETGYDCDGNCLFDADGDGVCDQWEVSGCQDASACNYNGAATDAGYCHYAADGYDCDGTCLNDADGDGVCDEFEIAGCTAPAACNFAADATDEDGSCTYAEAGYDCDGNCLLDSDGDGVCDQNELTGCQDNSACNFDGDATDAGYCDYPTDGYDCDGNCLSDTDGDGVCDEFEIAGCTAPAACNFAADATDDDGSCAFAEAGYDCSGNCLFDADGDGVCDQWEVTGCQDDAACNFDGDATDAGYCDYPADGYDCDGSCLNDADGDGVCDEFEIAGCTTPAACNFAADATDDDGSCSFAEAGYDCNGNCLFDADGDGVCDQWEVTGCQDDSACNYAAEATDEGTCMYAEPGRDCAGTCLNDADEDGVCDADELAGCLDETALNYVAYATDEALCIYESDFVNNCPSDLSGDGEINTADLLLLLSGLGYSCEEYYGIPE